MIRSIVPILPIVPALACIVACSGTTTPTGGSSSAQPPAPTTEITDQETIPASAVTMAEYNKLESGMTYSEVVWVLGSSGSEVSSSSLGGFQTVMYTWENPASLINPVPGNMNATFQNGELISKAQFGLPGPATDPNLDERLLNAATKTARDESQKAQAEAQAKAEEKLHQQAEDATEKERRREPDAMSKFRAAKMYHEIGNHRMRDARLKELIEEYPDTEGGRKAKEFMETVESDPVGT